MGLSNWRVDRWLLIPALILLGISVLMVFSTTAIFSERTFGDPTRMAKMHLLHVAVGLAAMFAAARFPPRLYYKLSVPFALFALLLLIAVLIPGLGHIAGGARRWIGFGPLRFQPGELAKLAFVLYMASYIGRHHERMISWTNGTVIPLAIVAFVGALLLLEPDFGSTVILGAVVFCQLTLVARLRHLALCGAVGLGGLVALAVASPYRFRRIKSFLDPFEQADSAGYQLIQSLIAVGSGGVGGEGLGVGKQKLFYLPAAHTDFIFAVISEELGLWGSLGVLLLFLLIGLRGIRIARRLVSEPFLAALCLGCTMLIVLPALLNMGVVLGLFPTKGLVLPLVAYGGTAMIVHLIALGIVLRLSSVESNIG